MIPLFLLPKQNNDDVDLAAEHVDDIIEEVEQRNDDHADHDDDNDPTHS